VTIARQRRKTDFAFRFSAVEGEQPSAFSPAPQKIQMRPSTPALTLITTSTALFLACSPAATGTHTPASPTPAVAAAQNPPAKAAQPAAPEQPAQAAASASEPAPEQGDGIRKASRPPHDLITAPDVLFVFNFAESEVGASAKERCEESGEDAAAVRACLTAARAKVPVESVQFTKDKSGNWWWVTYNTYKGNLLKWHKVQFALGEQTSDEITLRLTGKDKGIAPMARVPRTLSINLPNDYSIVVRHPEFGGMTFDAKIGILQPDSDS
jgi:hypothetical protein